MLQGLMKKTKRERSVNVANVRGELKMKGFGRFEGKLSETRPRGGGLTQTSTIYPEPSYFYPHAHPFICFLLSSHSSYIVLR